MIPRLVKDNFKNYSYLTVCLHLQISFVLYGMISAVGVRNVVENRVDFTKSRNVLIAAMILGLAVGVSYNGAIVFSVGAVTISMSGLAIGWEWRSWVNRITAFSVFSAAAAGNTADVPKDRIRSRQIRVFRIRIIAGLFLYWICSNIPHPVIFCHIKKQPFSQRRKWLFRKYPMPFWWMPAIFPWVLCSRRPIPPQLWSC